MFFIYHAYKGRKRRIRALKMSPIVTKLKKWIVAENRKIDVLGIKTDSRVMSLSPIVTTHPRLGFPTSKFDHSDDVHGANDCVKPGVVGYGSGGSGQSQGAGIELCRFL